MAKHDDFSCDPSKWSQDKLLRERRNGMPAVVAEYERRIGESEPQATVPHVVQKRYDDFSCDPSRWSDDKLSRERRNGMPAVVAEVERRANEREIEQESEITSVSGFSFR
ncbi:hypothetical protein [Rhizobium sp. MHM7A]|uniref:hypothetical protein n=1 Tax=Rhizobium sp. MHM7A TaxID=2583233 RepID=UPI001106F08F|nr:hypothetical protein [Rhizobium sp. MHM7A]TLX17141.1 hypothetical protein FFR93_07470 [Rhizobium sp. MHM7A]